MTARITLPGYDTPPMEVDSDSWHGSQLRTVIHSKKLTVFVNCFSANE